MSDKENESPNRPSPQRGATGRATASAPPPSPPSPPAPSYLQQHLSLQLATERQPLLMEMSQRRPPEYLTGFPPRRCTHSPPCNPLPPVMTFFNGVEEAAEDAPHHFSSRSCSAPYRGRIRALSSLILTARSTPPLSQQDPAAYRYCPTCRRPKTQF